MRQTSRFRPFESATFVLGLCLLVSVVACTSLEAGERAYAVDGAGAPISQGATPFLAVAKSIALPLNKRYSELSEEEKAIVLADYKTMPPGDEPPFPLDGMVEIVNGLVAAHQPTREDIDLSLSVDVGEDGRAIAVKAFGKKSTSLSRSAASILALAKYKPAICSGKPCRGEYLFRMRFEGGY